MKDSALSGLDIREVWYSLGGSKLRGNRGQAFWRNGDGFNVLLDDKRAAWHDFKTGFGGGILDLVRAVLGNDTRTCLTWLEDNLGLDNRLGQTIDERRDRQSKLSKARTDAEALCDRRDCYLSDLRTAAGILLGTYHLYVRLGNEDKNIDHLAKAHGCWQKLNEITARRDWIVSASGPELREFFGALETAK